MQNAIYEIEPRIGSGSIKLGMNLEAICNIVNLPIRKINSWNIFDRYVFDECFIDVAINPLGLCSAISFGFNSPITVMLGDFIFFEGTNMESLKSIIDVFQFLRQLDEETHLITIGDANIPGGEWGCISRNLGIGACSNNEACSFEEDAEDAIDMVLIFDSNFYQNCLIERWGLKNLI